MTRYWVPFCYSDAALLRGIYLASCRDLTRKERKKGNKPDAEMYEQNALQYKGDCLRSMYEAMPTNEQPVVTDNAIGMALFLAFNEVCPVSVRFLEIVLYDKSYRLTRRYSTWLVRLKNPKVI